MTLGKYKYIWKIFVRYDSLQYAGRVLISSTRYGGNFDKSSVASGTFHLVVP